MISSLAYLDEDAFYNFTNSVVEETKFCSEVMKKHFNKKLVMTKEDDKDFENSTKYWVCDNACYVYVDGGVKVKDHFHITGKI